MSHSQTAKSLKNSGGSLRVAMDVRSLSGARTGVGTYAANLLAQLLLLDPDLQLVLIAAESIPDGFSLHGERVRKVSNAAYARNNVLWTNLTLRRELRKSAPVLFHSPGYTLPLHPAVPSVVTVHDVSYAAQPQWYPHVIGPLRKAWYGSAVRGAVCVLTDSEFSRREIIRNYRISESRVRVSYLGVDRRVYLTMDDREEQAGIRRRYDLPEKFVLFVGDIHPRRNVERVADAVRSIRESEATMKNLGLVLAGRFLVPFEGSSQAAAIADRRGVRALGYVPAPDLPILYRAACALAYPSFYEGFGLPVLEAMSCGCPVLTSRNTSCAEIAGDAAVLVDPSDARAIQEGLRSLLLNPGLADEMRSQGIARAERFTWRHTAEETLAVYRDIAAGRVH